MDLRDPVSSASHLFTAVWAVYATALMWRLTPADSGRRWAAVVFGLSMVLLYAASGTFHGVPFNKYDHPAEFRFFQKLDQTAIFFLIAGTSTPVYAFVLTGAWRKWFLRMTWGCAAAGVAALWLLPKVPHGVTVAIYLFMGWLGVIPVVHFYRALGWRAMNWVWAGAACYTVGAACELANWPVIVPGWLGYHEVFHFFDMAGSLVLFLFIVKFVLPHSPPANLAAADVPAADPELAHA